MIYLLTDDLVIPLCYANDIEMDSLSQLKLFRFRYLVRKILKLSKLKMSDTLVCDEESIKTTLSLLKYIENPLIISMGKYQYRSDSDFWRKYGNPK